MTSPRPLTRTGMRRLRIGTIAAFVILLAIFVAPAVVAKVTGAPKLTWPVFLA